MVQSDQTCWLAKACNLLPSSSQNTAACLCLIRHSNVIYMIPAQNAALHIKRHMIKMWYVAATCGSSSDNFPQTSLLRATAVLACTWIMYQREGFAALLQVGTAVQVTKQLQDAQHILHCIRCVNKCQQSILSMMRC